MKAIIPVITVLLLLVGCSEKVDHVANGWALYEQGDYDGAIAEFNLEENNLAGAYNGLGWSYYSKEDYGQAKGYFEKAIGANPTKASSYNGLGWSLYKNKDYQNAAIECEKGLLLEPDNNDLKICRAKALYRLSSNLEAEQLLLSIDKSYENYDEALVYLAFIEYWKDDFLKSIEYAQQMENMDFRAYNIVGWSYLEQSDIENARVSFTKSGELNPDDVDYMFGLAYAHYMSQNCNEAVPILNDIITNHPDYFDITNVQKTLDDCSA